MTDKKVLLCGVWLEDENTWTFEVFPFIPDDVILGALEEFIKVIKEGKLKPKLNVEIAGQKVIEEEIKLRSHDNHAMNDNGMTTKEG